MAIIKCKMCGGDMEISADKTFGTCEYCGSTMTLPKVSDEQRFSLLEEFYDDGEISLPYLVTYSTGKYLI